jgi:hypothetical protein
MRRRHIALALAATLFAALPAAGGGAAETRPTVEVVFALDTTSRSATPSWTGSPGREPIANEPGAVATG